MVADDDDNYNHSDDRDQPQPLPPVQMKTFPSTNPKLANAKPPVGHGINHDLAVRQPTSKVIARPALKHSHKRASSAVFTEHDGLAPESSLAPHIMNARHDARQQPTTPPFMPPTRPLIGTPHHSRVYPAAGSSLISTLSPSRQRPERYIYQDDARQHHPDALFRQPVHYEPQRLARFMEPTYRHHPADRRQPYDSNAQYPSHAGPIPDPAIMARVRQHLEPAQPLSPVRPRKMHNTYYERDHSNPSYSRLSPPRNVGLPRQRGVSSPVGSLFSNTVCSTQDNYLPSMRHMIPYDNGADDAESSRPAKRVRYADDYPSKK
jgi:hypothetical protein